MDSVALHETAMMLRISALVVLAACLPSCLLADEPVVGGKKKSEWLKIIKDGETPRARQSAIAALSVMEPKDRAIYDAIADAMLTDKSEQVRLRALDGAAVIMLAGSRESNFIESFGKALSTDKSEAVRVKAASIAKELKKDDLGKLLPVLGDVLKSDASSAVRAAAAASLSKAGERVKTVLNLMVEALGDKEPAVRAAVAESLGRIGDEAKSTVPKLAPLLKDADATVRLAAAFALGRVGPDAASAVPELATALANDSDANVRKEAARAFTLLGLDAKGAVPALAKALRSDKSDDVRRQCALALGKMRNEVGSVTATILEAIRLDPEKTVRVFAVHALADSLGSALKDYVKELAEQLTKDSDPDVRLAIVQELGVLGPEAKDAIPALRRAATDVQLSVRDEAKKALKRVMGQ